MSDIKKIKAPLESKPDLMIDEVEEKWNPTPEVFNAFLVRDFELATSNVKMLLSDRTYPMGIKELKGSTLHSSEVIDRVLAKGIKDGTIKEVNGSFILS